MKEITCKKLQEIGGFALAGGCTRKRMKQLVEMIRAARDYRWVGVYKIMKDEFRDYGRERRGTGRRIHVSRLAKGCAVRPWSPATRHRGRR